MLMASLLFQWCNVKAGVKMESSIVEFGDIRLVSVKKLPCCGYQKLIRDGKIAEF